MSATVANSAGRARKGKPVSELGRRILERLESKGWSQSRLARELGVSAQAVSGVLRQSYISAPLALRLSDLLGVTVKYLAPDF